MAQEIWRQPIRFTVKMCSSMRMSLRTAIFVRGRRAARALALLCCAALCVALPAAASATIPTAAPSVKKVDKAGICVAQTLKNDKLVPLRQSLYRYRYVKIRKGRHKGRFRRRIIQVRVQVKTSCITQCVQLRKKGQSLVPVFRTRRVWVREPHRGRLVRVKRLRRVWLLGPCASLPSIETLGTPVTITLLDNSQMTFDFSAFKRQGPLTGALRGYVPGKILPDADNQVILTSGSFNLGKTTMFSDKVCGGAVSDSIRTAEPTTVHLDPGKQSTLILGQNGTLNAKTFLVLDIPLELRNGDDGCGKPYITTGYSSASETVNLSGKIGAAGLSQVPVSMPATDLDLVGCLTPGLATQECNGFQLPLPSTVSMSLMVSVVAGTT